MRRVLTGRPACYQTPLCSPIRGIKKVCTTQGALKKTCSDRMLLFKNVQSQIYLPTSSFLKHYFVIITFSRVHPVYTVTVTLSLRTQSQSHCVRSHCHTCRTESWRTAKKLEAGAQSPSHCHCVHGHGHCHTVIVYTVTLSLCTQSLSHCHRAQSQFHWKLCTQSQSHFHRVHCHWRDCGLCAQSQSHCRTVTLSRCHVAIVDTVAL